MRFPVRSVILTVATAALMGSSALAGSRETTTRPITKPKFIPTAERVELFAAMEDGRLETRVQAKGPLGGSVFIKNTTDKPLTVELPAAFATTQVLKQLGVGGGGFGGGGQQGGGFGGGGQQGGGQNQGGGFGGQQGGGGFGGQQGGGFGGGQQGGGNGFFSIPPERIVKLPYISVCLEHGKKDPSPLATYKLVKLEEYTEDPVLRELITMVGSGRLPAEAAQAAMWTRTDNMSWQQLAAKTKFDIVRGKVPYFNPNALRTAQMIVASAEGRVREAQKAGKQPTGQKPRQVQGRVR